MGDRLPMEKRKGVTLRALLARYLLMTGALLALLAAAAWSLFVLLMTGGFILPASSGQQAALQSAARLRQEGAFDAAALDPLCGYVYFDGGGGVAQSNLPQKRLDDAQRMLRGQERTSLLGAAWYYERVEFADGGFCLLQYDYSVPYGDPALRGRLPDFQTVYLTLCGLTALALIVLTTLHYSRRLGRAADKLARAGAMIAAGELERGDFTATGVRELDGAMDAMRTLKETLSGSLRAQWRLEQQRAEQIAALAHDLKTPLTVIGGNAELLAEEPLSARAQGYVAAIRRSGGRAEGYLKALRQAAGADGPEASPALQRVNAAEFVSSLRQAALDVCRLHGTQLAMEESPPGALLQLRAEPVRRALLNLLENAAEAAPGGHVQLALRLRPQRVDFVVEDDGPGFSPQDLRRGTEQFYRGDAARPGDGHSGLGLYACRRTAEAAGGSLTLENSPATGGARVTLTLPQA